VNKLCQLADLGQAIWLDYARRLLITSGELQSLIDEGLRGTVFNLPVFQKVIAGSVDYGKALCQLAEEGKVPEAIYEALALDDVRHAADLLYPVYQRTEGTDGYASFDISPYLAHDTEGMIAEARRLFSALGRPNVMVKVPATAAGIPAIEALTSEGINVHATLIFSPAHYEAAAEAYIAGLEKRLRGDKTGIWPTSVAAISISPVDTVVDRALEKMDETPLQGRIAIANAKAAYARFRSLLTNERWQHLAMQGARIQRILWDNTGTKHPLYPDTLYVDSLMGPNTVNAVPRATLIAFLDHGSVAPTLTEDLETSHVLLERLAGLGIDLDAIAQQLQDESVAKLIHSFDSLLATIAQKRSQLLSGWRRQWADLGSCQSSVNAALAQTKDHQVVARIWVHDHTLWKPKPAEITNRLGWLHIVEAMAEHFPRLDELVEEVQAAGYTDALLLGMGGSSLAPQVFRTVFGVREGYLDLDMLDSTDPGAVLSYAERLDPARTLFIVATKSGTTAETLSFLKFFYNWTADTLGVERAGEHFIAITDPGTYLADLACRHGFRATFLNDPNIGGRYSALSYFGLVPAALVGVNVPLLLDRAMEMIYSSEPCVMIEDNPAAWLGTILGELAEDKEAKRDKATLIASDPIASFGDWVEQLIAESTGKEGKGILPVVGEPLGAPEVYGQDRLFIHLRLRGDRSHDTALAALREAGHPVVHLSLRDPYDLGAQCFLWEMAIAVAGYHLRINPFDQPNVEATKALAREMIAQYLKEGRLPRGDSAPLTAGALEAFLAQGRPGDYIALQAYLQPTAETDAALSALRIRLRDRYRLATTLGYGPRFLHSTGQLHKGDAGHGLFIQFTADDSRDAPIPDKMGSPKSSITFGVLKTAQAIGDRRTLLDARRRVMHFHLERDVPGELRCLLQAIE